MWSFRSNLFVFSIRIEMLLPFTEYTPKKTKRSWSRAIRYHRIIMGSSTLIKIKTKIYRWMPRFQQIRWTEWMRVRINSKDCRSIWCVRFSSNGHFERLLFVPIQVWTAKGKEIENSLFFFENSLRSSISLWSSCHHAWRVSVCHFASLILLVLKRRRMWRSRTKFHGNCFVFRMVSN